MTVDFGSENEKPARFFVECRTNSSIKTFGYLFSEKDSRQKMNNIIAINVLNILSNQINNPSFVYSSVKLSEFPKRKAELLKEENKKYYDMIYLLL